LKICQSHVSFWLGGLSPTFSPGSYFHTTHLQRVIICQVDKRETHNIKHVCNHLENVCHPSMAISWVIQRHGIGSQSLLSNKLNKYFAINQNTTT
jgi:hypothetical protein